MNTEEFSDDLPLRHELDVDIIMHRDVHFGANFTIMLDYYQKQGKGIRSEFDYQKIQALAELEKRMGKNLAPELLSGRDAEKVARAKEAYNRFRDLYDKKHIPHFPRLIADLILSEEEVPQEEIQAIVKEKGAIVPSLLEILRAQDYYDPLFPGYGQAPSLAAKCLGLIGDKRAIIALFEAIGEEDFFNEEILLQSLKEIGEPAKEFLLQVMQGHPINFDNERAAIALIYFKDDPRVSETCFKMLLDPAVKKDIALSTYLALACEGLKDPDLRKKFKEVAEDPKTASSLRRDMKTVSNSWKQAEQ
jgi:HEAT repeat protein